MNADDLGRLLAVRLRKIVPTGFHVVYADDGLLWYSSDPGRFAEQTGTYRVGKSGTYLRNNFVWGRTVQERLVNACVQALCPGRKSHSRGGSATMASVTGYPQYSPNDLSWLEALLDWFDNRKQVNKLRRAQDRIGLLILRTTGDVPVASRGFITTGTPADVVDEPTASNSQTRTSAIGGHLLEGSFVRAGNYLLDAYQLIYVVTSEQVVLAAGLMDYEKRRDVGVDELQAEMIDLRQIRSYRCFPAEYNFGGYVHLTPVDGTTIRVVLRPDVMNPPPAAKNAAERMMCNIAGGFGAEEDQ